MSEIAAYIDAVFAHWLWLMSAGPFLVDRMVSLFSKDGSVWHKIAEKMRGASFNIMATGLIIAMFLAWKQEYRKNTSHAQRNLTATESMCITDNIAPEKETFQYAMIFRATDEDSSLYAVGFYEAFVAAGAEPILQDWGKDSPDQQGVMLFVKDPNNPPGRAKKLVAILEGKCKIPIRFTRWRTSFGPEDIGIYIAPSRH